MKQRLLTRTDVLKVMNRLQKERPASLFKVLDGDNDLWLKAVDYDEFVAELNEWVYKIEGGDA